MKRMYMEWMRSGGPEVTPAARLKRASPAMLCTWIVEASVCISEALVRVPSRSARFQTPLMALKMTRCGKTSLTREFRNKVRQTSVNLVSVLLGLY
uniref:POGO family transposable element n=1 Tax=Rhipicephalus zambeziensis TaxID=60191 RepID=A0A224YW11_9ACAR